MTYTQLKITLRDKKQQLADARAKHIELVTFGKSDDASMIERNVAKAEVVSLEDAVKTLEANVDRMEAEMRAKDAKEPQDITVTEDVAKANYYRAAAGRTKLTDADRKFLGALPGGATYGNGELLLPQTVQTSLVHEAFEINPLRQYVTYTGIDGLQIPTMDSDVLTAANGLLVDGTPAVAINVEAGMIKFAKERFAVMTEVAESVLNSTNVNLVQYIEGTLRSKLALTEHEMMFGAKLDHRNLFNPANAVPVYEGATIYDSILTAFYELHPMFQANACVVMHPTDFVALRKELANSSETLFAEGRRQIEGMPIVLDASVGFEGKGIVLGDFRHYQFNYESTSSLKTDEDIKRGLHVFVLAAEVDARIITPLAFKIIKKKVV